MTLSAKEQFIKALAAVAPEEVPDTGLYCFEDVVCIALASDVQIPYALEDDEVYIVGVTSHAQRTEQRHGSRAMEMLGRIADQFNVTLMLDAVPVGADAPTPEKLREFYSKQGFVQIEKGRPFMYREPQGPALDQVA